MTNRRILFWLFVLCYVGQNSYYGWNLKPMSPAEAWWDQLCINLLIFSLFVRKVYYVREVA